MLRITLVDDSVAVQRSLGRLLAAVPGVEIVGCAQDVPGAISVIDAERPDVVVLDVNLLDDDKGIDVLRYIRRQRPGTKVVVLSDFTSQRLRDGFIAAGADAYYDKATEFMQARDWIAALPALAPGADAA